MESAGTPHDTRKHPVNTRVNRRIFGIVLGLATPAAAEVLAVAPRPALVPDLRALLREAGLHRRMPRPLKPDLQVVRGEVPLGLTPSVGQEVLKACGGGLPKLVGPRDPHEQALVDDFLVVGHGPQRVAGHPERSPRGTTFSPRKTLPMVHP